VRIGDLARRTGVTQKALRYYERLGVLTPVRGENGYREYREADVRVVGVVRSLGRLGIPVEQTRPFLDCLGAGHEHPDDCVASMAAYRSAIAQLTERIDALAEMRDELVARLEHAALRAAAERQEEEQSAVTDYMSLPSDLPAPEDDGAADHLAGLAMPPITLPGTAGSRVALDDLGPGRTVLYIYPLSGRPGVDLPDGWDAIPGARGCTPEACGFRDHHADLRAAGATAVFGLSSQSTDYQAELAERLDLPFEILSDPDLEVADALRLPTFTADDRRLYKRLTLVVTDGRIEHAFYPIFPPDQHAAEVLQWLRDHASGRA
jgi:peroxiredoxin/DNA-binding transcriptional MerR regulator